MTLYQVFRLSSVSTKLENPQVDRTYPQLTCKIPNPIALPPTQLENPQFDRQPPCPTQFPTKGRTIIPHPDPLAKPLAEENRPSP
jgi:hypothetical protein